MKSICSLASRCIALTSLICLTSSGAQLPAIISSVPVTGVSGGGGSFAPVFDRLGGRFVVFLSHANNLVTNDNASPFLDVFSHDLETGRTVLVSVNRSGTGGGDADSAQAAQSGLSIVFATAAGNMGEGWDTNGAQDIYIRDSEESRPIPVSFTTDGIALGPASLSLRLSGSPAVVHDGFNLKVVFESGATNLASLPDTNNASDIFVFNHYANPESLVSVNAAGTAAGNGPSERPVVSSDGYRIAFLSKATDLVPGTTNTLGDIYVRDLFTQTTLWASSNVFDHLPTYRCHPPVISINGQAVVFKASAPGAANAAVFHVDLATGITSLLHTNSPTATDVVVSGDGNTVAFDDGEQVFLWHGGVTTLISKQADGSTPANGNSTSPVLSLDGQVIAYVSAATDIVTNGVPATNTAYQIYVLNRQTGVTRLVTQNTNRLAAAASHQFSHIALSPDGTQIAFDSLDSDLVPGDLNAASDVFITPVASNALTLISRRAESLPSLTGMRNVRITPDCLSADKRFLLFASLNKNPSPFDPVRGENLFIRNLATGAEEQITEFGIEKPKEQVISANGRTVAYITQAHFNPSVETVVVFDRTTGERILAHTNSLAGGFLSGPFTKLTISPDGRRIAYLNSTSGRYDFAVYLFEVESRSNRFVNARFYAPERIALGDLSAPRFSPNGDWLAFGHGCYDLTTNRYPGLAFLDLLGTKGIQDIPSLAYGRPTFHPTFSTDSRYVGAAYGVFDLQTRTYSPVPDIAFSNQPRRYSLSANGQIIAWEAGSGGWNIAVTNRQTRQTKIVSMNAVPNPSVFPSITPDGRYLLFATRATNLLTADQNGRVDIYLHDLRRDATLLLSSPDSGATPGNGSSTMPILSADGRTVLFQSLADDLVPGDYNFSRDIFMAQIGGPDSDGDQMDDDWEMAYFSTLSRHGTGDFDGDGASDFAEFQTGTDPTDLGSILRVVTITNLAGGHPRIVWSASPGRTYRVQFKGNVEDAQWSELPGTVTAVGTTASVTDETADSRTHRFYRVSLVP